MFDHISLGVRDIVRSRRFYDAALKPLGFSRLLKKWRLRRFWLSDC